MNTIVCPRIKRHGDRGAALIPSCDTCVDYRTLNSHMFKCIHLITYIDNERRGGGVLNIVFNVINSISLAQY